MNRSATTQLRRELLDAGARPEDLVGLVAAAQAASRFGKAEWAERRRGRFRLPRLASFGLTAAAGLALGVGLVVLAQSALPGSFLYPIQQASDAVALWVRPDYRATLMTKRMIQMTALIDHHAGQPQILAAVADYQSAAADYQAASGNYQILEFCRSSLQRAGGQTTGAVHRAVEQALANLGDA